MSTDVATQRRIRKMGLRWEVSLHGTGYHYSGRGSTPDAALSDLRDCLALGLSEAKEQSELAEQRLADLTVYAASLDPKT